MAAKRHNVVVAYAEAAFLGSAPKAQDAGEVDGGTSQVLAFVDDRLVGAGLAAAIIRAGKTGLARVPQAHLTYAATVLWALVGVVVNQYDASLLTTGAAAVSAVVVVLAVFGAPGAGRARRAPGRTVRSGIV